jgi:hypothetical protein
MAAFDGFGGASPCPIAPSSGPHRTEVAVPVIDECVCRPHPRGTPNRVNAYLPTHRILGKLNVRPEARISLAPACPGINRRAPPRGIGACDLAGAAACAVRMGVLARRWLLLWKLIPDVE